MAATPAREAATADLAREDEVDFRFTAQEEEFRQEVRRFLEQELTPEFRESLEGREWSREFSMRMGAKGWLSLAWPKEYGGQERSHMEQLVFHEEMARYDAPIEWHRRASEQHGYAILIYGTEEQKRDLIPRIASAEISIANCMSEPEAGSDLANAQTRAVRDGDDYILNGQKRWTSGARFSTHGWLLARTEPEVRKHRGLSMFLVDLRSPGVEVRPLKDLRGSESTNEVFLDDVRVPGLYRIGEENRGWYVNATLMDLERSGIEAVVRNEYFVNGLIDCFRGYREEEGTSERLSLLRQRLAQLKIESTVSRLLSYRIAWLQSQGQVPNHETSIAKVFKTELSQKTARLGLDLFGQHGQLGSAVAKAAPLQDKDFLAEVQDLYFRSLSATIAQGTSEIHRNIIAQRGLGLPRHD